MPGSPDERAPRFLKNLLVSQASNSTMLSSGIVITLALIIPDIRKRVAVAPGKRSKRLRIFSVAHFVPLRRCRRTASGANATTCRLQ